MLVTEISRSARVPVGRRLERLVWCGLIVWAAERPVSAYIDPGSGALVWQAILAGIFGVMFYFRKFIGRFTFKKRKDEQTPPGSE
jgi:hypothetical protein